MRNILKRERRLPNPSTDVVKALETLGGALPKVAANMAAVGSAFYPPSAVRGALVTAGTSVPSPMPGSVLETDTYGEFQMMVELAIIKAKLKAAEDKLRSLGVEPEYVETAGGEAYILP